MIYHQNFGLCRNFFEGLSPHYPSLYKYSTCGSLLRERENFRRGRCCRITGRSSHVERTILKLHPSPFFIRSSWIGFLSSSFASTERARTIRLHPHDHSITPRDIKPTEGAYISFSPSIFNFRFHIYLIYTHLDFYFFLVIHSPFF